MNVKHKITWREVFDNFKAVYPNLSKGVRDFRPYNYMSIMVYMRDGSKIIYDDVVKRAKIISA